MTSLSFVAVALLSLSGTSDPVASRVPEAVQLAAPQEVRLDGFIGERFDRNRNGRLKHVPMDTLLAGFQKRPGSHPWIGEHIGKWIHAATLTWQNTQDPELRTMLDKAVRDLLATQQPDGYLGTYVEAERWTSWDVWVHKYDIIGLLAWYHATGDEAALKGARGVGNLLSATFGASKRDIITAGEHVGMAATSVLEPMVQLYRATGEAKYLDFCNYLLASWDQPNGPKVLASLLAHGKVNRTANGKAYEMMSNIVGMCELYRVTGDEKLLRAAKAAWKDVFEHQMYITGGVSLREHFQPDGHLPDIGDIAETCANVTWEQLSMQLLAITGDPQYADAIERVMWNHLLRAQTANGEDWCYFTVLAGRKSFRQDVNCCHSSGPRGVALLPTLFYGRTAKGIRINLYGPSRYQTRLADGTAVEIEQRTAYPADGKVVIVVKPEKPAAFALELRIPAWAKAASTRVRDGLLQPVKPGLATIDREWKPGDELELNLDVAPRWTPGTGEHEGMLACERGPVILCATAHRNASPELIGVEPDMKLEPAGEMPRMSAQERTLSASVLARILTPDGIKEAAVNLTPFTTAQSDWFYVWLKTPKLLEQIR